MKLLLKSAQEQLQIVHERLCGSSEKALTFNVNLLDRFLQGFLPSELIVVYGSSSSYALTDLLITRALLWGSKAGPDGDIVYIDGGNCFNLYRISTFTRQLNLNIKESLRKIHVSRAFTSHQLATLIVRELSLELERHPSRLVVISDLLSISRDEEIGAGEARGMLNLAVSSLRDLTTSKQIITLLPNPSLTTNRERRSLETFLWPKSDVILHLRELKNRARILREKHPLGEGQVDLDLKCLQQVS